MVCNSSGLAALALAKTAYSGGGDHDEDFDGVILDGIKDAHGAEAGEIDDFAAEHGGDQHGAHEAEGVEHGDDAQEDGFFVEARVLAGIDGVGLQVAVGEHDALGGARCAGGVHDDGHIVVVSWRQRADVLAEVGVAHRQGGHDGEAGAIKLEGLHCDDHDAGGGGELLAELLEELDGEDDLEAGVLDDVDEFFGFKQIVQRQGHAVGPAGAAEGDNEGGGGGDEEADFVAELGAGGELLELIDEQVHAEDEFAIGQRPLVVDDGDVVRTFHCVVDDFFENHGSSDGWRRLRGNGCDGA